ncbi:NACHT domain protein [Ilyonectria destructans]|nr:NACHT domain protein [Ilyonectria destructans]
MAQPAATAEPAFQATILDFKVSLGDNELYKTILETKTVDQVYDAMEQLQAEQAKKNAMGHLSKIFPYLERLQEYGRILDTFAQVKPDVLCLLWGPLKLLLQWASILKQSFDDIVNTIEEIGESFSEIAKFIKIFPDKECIPHILGLLFQDLLDFYSIALEFFKNSHWKLVYEAVWPRKRAKIRIAVSNLQRHCSQLKNRVQLEHLQAECDARIQAFDHFEKSEKSAQRIEYRGIKESFSPDDYDKDLEKLRGMVCEGTGQWLDEDADFLTWLDKSQKTDRTIWLQGIPGAGKTFLCSTVVRKALAVGPTLFAFLSHKFSASTTARSVVHSLLFQVCDSLEHLQAILCQTETRTLKLDLEAAVSLLRDLLCNAGPVFMVIDGLDEIEGMERARLLRCLLQVSNDCKETRILISSRMEPDIEGILRDKSTPIRVDGRNHGSIQVFISHHLHEWFEERNFIREARNEITKLLAPLAPTSKGMFMYAKVVLSSVEDLDDIDSIRESLQVLPKDLDEAYERILQRIDSLKPARADKARKLLGWVGSSPCPMTKQEMEAALTIRMDDSDGCRGVIAETTAMKDCGPLLEVIDDYVQFVHFTVKEYIFSSHIPNNPISLVEFSFSLANSCIQYLCQRHHDSDLSDDELEKLLILGVFRLHDYASTMWLELVEQCCRLCHGMSRGDQTNLLQLLHKRRHNELFDRKDEPSVASLVVFIFQETNPSIHKLLWEAACFREKWSEEGFDRRETAPWIGLDPLTITRTSVSLFSAVDRLLCGTVSHRQDCRCHEVQWHFGERPFKCGFLGCFFRRHGFGTKAFRNAHQKCHDRSWKCTEPDCQFSQGFLSRKMRDQHWEHCHREGAQTLEIPKGMDQSEKKSILIDLIKANNVALITSLAPEFRGCWNDRDVAEMAGRFGSIPLFSHILSQPAFYYHSNLVSAAIAGGRIDAFQHLMFNSQLGLHISNVLSDILTSDIQAFRDGWEQLVDMEFDYWNNKQRKKLNQVAREFTTSNIYPTLKRPEDTTFLLQIWDRIDIGKTLGPVYLGDALVDVATTCCSIELARYLLGLGATIDHRRSGTFLTPLHHAARKDSAVAAEFIKLLLEQGADPEAYSVSIPAHGSKIRRIRDERGAKNISKWLSMSWDELVEATKGAREGKE